jgi:hypothetical protein
MIKLIAASNNFVREQRIYVSSSVAYVLEKQLLLNDFDIIYTKTFFPLVNSIRGHRYCVYPVLKSAEILVGEKLLITAIHVIFSMSEGKAKNVNYLRPRQCMLICRQIFCI